MSKVDRVIDQSNVIKLNRLYATTGGLAIVFGASLAAFTAKSPTTLAMWASAYLVLVVGVAQVFFAIVVAQLARKSAGRLVGWFYGLFNTGSAVVIISSVLKYSGHEQHVGVTVVGALLVLAAMCLMVSLLQSAQSSSLKAMAYVMIALLASTSLIGIILAGID